MTGPLRLRAPCPQCGTPRARQTLDDGTVINVWLRCPNDYCDPGALEAHERSQNVQAALRLLGFSVFLALVLFATFVARQGVEDLARDECEEAGGSWESVRAWPLWWPTGRGVCRGAR